MNDDLENTQLLKTSYSSNVLDGDSLVREIQTNLLPAITVENFELELHPGYPVVFVNPTKLIDVSALNLSEEYKIFELYSYMLALLGLTAPNNPYVSAIEKILPDKAILLLNDENKFCTTYSEKIGGLTLAGIRYGGIHHQQKRYCAVNENDSGHMEMVPVSTDLFPIDKYTISSSDKFHDLACVFGGTNTWWSGKYLAAHFIIGLMTQYLYHDNTDMVSIGGPIMNTSRCCMPHTHYKKIQNPLKLEQHLKT